MREIISGKVYDTEEATLIASGRRSNGWRNHLYRSQKGAWFEVRQEVFLFWTVREIVGPMNPEQAYRWLHGSQQIELLRKYFAEKVNDA